MPGRSPDVFLQGLAMAGANELPGPGPGRPPEVPDDHHCSLNSLVPVQPVFTDAGRLALAGYLAGYRGLTRDAYTLDLRQFSGWRRRPGIIFSYRTGSGVPVDARSRA